MNKQRRKELQEIYNDMLDLERLVTAANDLAWGMYKKLSLVIEAEETYADNMPANMQYSQKYKRAIDVCYQLERLQREIAEVGDYDSIEHGVCVISDCM
tara:strand:- start:1258 stop:1554 length:297 start_codon:yes stop_codon:yes gene_type:complete